MAGEQGRQPGQGRNAQGLRDAVPRGRRGTDSKAPAAPAQKTTAAAPAATGQKTVKACIEEWRANKAANEAKGVTQKAYVADCRTGKTTAQPTLVPTHSRNRRGQRQRLRQLRPGTAAGTKDDNRGCTACSDGTDGCEPVRDGRPGQIPLRRRNGRLGQSRIQRSITSAATRLMARPKRARICASGMPRARACAPRKTRSIPEVKERSAAPVT